jgi:hypothetical protein
VSNLKRKLLRFGAPKLRAGIFASDFLCCHCCLSSLFDVHTITLLTPPLHTVSFDIISIDTHPSKNMVLDTRRIVGSKVHAKALHVTNNAECSRRYGAGKTNKRVEGTVVEAKEVQKAGNSRMSWFITADYDLGGGDMKRAVLNTRSVKSGKIPSVIPVVLPVPPALPIPAPDPPIPVEIALTPANVPAQVDPFIIAGAEINAVEGLIQELEEELQLPVPMPPPPLPLPPGRQPTTIAHETAWYEDPEACLMSMNGNVAFREWTIRTVIGHSLGPGSDSRKSMSRLEYFLLMFPPDQLSTMVTLTSENLLSKTKAATTPGEVLKFFGVLILVTRFEFSARASLWSNTAPSKYQPAPSFGKTGMSRHRFDTIMASVRFSRQPPVRPDHMSTEAYRWLLVDGFVDNFNSYRESNFSPSDVICADESISRWYGQGGYWINHGLPQYIAIDRKPEFGCEIQNSCCGRSGIMMRLKLVKTAEEEGTHAQPGDDGLLHGTAVLKYLVLPWARTDRIVCADSYFASVGTLKELKRLGLRFIGVVKTATKQFPQSYLANLEMRERGERRGVIARDENDTPYMLAFCWMDRDRRYFISSASSLQPGRAYTRHRWRQVSNQPNAAPERVELEIPQPQAAELYYDACGMIDRHNRCRQDDLMLERKLGTMDWSMRVNTSLLGMCIVDAWYAYSQCTKTRGANAASIDEKQKDFYSYLAEELIDNTYDSVGRRNRENTPERAPRLVTVNGLARCGVEAHLSPTKRRRVEKGVTTKGLYQGKCRICKKKTVFVCSACKDANEDGILHGKEVWLCMNKQGETCFIDHLSAKH